MLERSLSARLNLQLSCTDTTLKGLRLKLLLIVIILFAASEPRRQTNREDKKVWLAGYCGWLGGAGRCPLGAEP